MGGSPNREKAAAQSAYSNMWMADEVYGIAHPAMKGGVEYLRGAYDQGGDQAAIGALYGSRQTDLLEASAQRGGDIFAGSLGQGAGARAAGLSGIGTQRLSAGVDEINKLRSGLAQRGLQTTNLAQQAGAVSIGALGLMPQGNPALSAILGAGAVGASIYGGFANQSQQQGGRYSAPIGPQPGTGTPNPSYIMGSVR